MKKVMLVVAAMVVIALVCGCGATGVTTLRCPIGQPVAMFLNIDSHGQSKVVCGVPAKGEKINISISDMKISGEVITPPNIQLLWE